MARILKHHIALPKKNDLQIMYRTMDRAKYELIARLTVTRPSLQRTIDERIFPPGWEKELEVLRKLQRKQGFKDSDFLHNKDRVAQGLPPLMGRRK